MRSTAVGYVAAIIIGLVASVMAQIIVHATRGRTRASATHDPYFNREYARPKGLSAGASTPKSGEGV